MTPEARLIVVIALFALFFGGLVAVCVLAWLKGRPAERYGATLYLVSVAGTTLLELITGKATPAVPELCLDALVAIGFLSLSLKYNNLWLGGAMMGKGLQLALHSIHLTDTTDPSFGGVNLYAAGLSLISFAIVAIIWGGTLVGIRERRRAGASQGRSATMAA